MTLQQRIEQLVATFGNRRESLLPILQKLVSESKYLSKEAMQEVALQMGLSAADVYGTASFYSFLETEKRGQNVIRICKTISCDMKEKNSIVSMLEKQLNIKLGETTHDNKFTLLETNCLGQCHKGPAMLINDDIYTELTAGKAIEIIEEYAKKN